MFHIFNIAGQFFTPASTIWEFNWEGVRLPALRRVLAFVGLSCVFRITLGSGKDRGFFQVSGLRARWFQFLHDIP